MTIMDMIMLRMIAEYLSTEKGFQIFSTTLEQHSLQRPPFTIEVFSRDDIENSKRYALAAFFKHFSLYEFAFKPRVEMTYKIKPVIPVLQKLEDFSDLEPVDPSTIPCLSQYLPKVEEKPDFAAQQEEEARKTQQQLLESQESQTVEEVISFEMARLRKMARRTMKLKEVEFDQLIEEGGGGKKKK
jgi:hypothetical protein